MSGTQIELLKAWYLFSFSLGVWTCLNLIVTQQAKTVIKLCIVSYIVILLVPSINGYLTVLYGEPIYWLNRIGQNLTWAYGPLLYFLVKHSTLQTVTIKEVLAHLAPLVIVNVARSLTIFLDYHWLFVSGLFVHISIYGFVSFFVIQQNKTKLTNLVQGHKNSLYFWLMFLALGLLVSCLFDLTIIISFSLGLSPNVILITKLACIISVYVSLVALCSIFRPPIFRNDIDTQVTSESPDQKLRNVELSVEVAEKLQSQLDKLVSEYRPHMDDSISLSKLASLLGVTRNQLSELFNVHMNISFYDFLNDLRYQESLKLLDRGDDKFSIADIAYQAGFNNRNTFYKVFKQKTGVTPTEYKKVR